MSNSRITLTEYINEILLERFGDKLDESEHVGELDGELDELAPSGYEKVVRALKKDKKVDNP